MLCTFQIQAAFVFAHNRDRQLIVMSRLYTKLPKHAQTNSVDESFPLRKTVLTANTGK